MTVKDFFSENVGYLEARVVSFDYVGIRRGAKCIVLKCEVDF